MDKEINRKRNIFRRHYLVCANVRWAVIECPKGHMIHKKWYPDPATTNGFMCRDDSCSRFYPLYELKITLVRHPQGKTDVISVLRSRFTEPIYCEESDEEHDNGDYPPRP